MGKKILIIEDEKNLARFVSLELLHEGYDVVVETNGREGLDTALEKDFDLILLDLMLPEMDGFEITRRLQAEKTTYIMMMTARDSVMDIVAGLDRGADDYIVKPFSPREVVLRVKALLRRTQTANTEQSEPHARDIIEFSHLVIDNDAHRVLADDQQVNLTPKEYELLIYLAKTPNKVFDREQLLKEVWHYEFYGDLRTVDTHVKRLREKLNRVSSDAAQMIQTVWGVGYKFEVKPSDEPTK